MGSLLKIIMALLVVQTASAELTNGLYAAFDTSMGSFTCRLDYAEAPLTCANFVGLAEGSQAFVSTHGAVVEAPFYDGLIFHRVITNFMIQGGCPLGNGTSGPGYAFPDEFGANLTHSTGGILSMANSGPDSNGSQFFITLTPTTWLDGVHSIFGEVVDGMNVISNIGAVSVGANNRPLTDVVMNTIQILRVGSAAAAFDPADQPLPEAMPLQLVLTNGISSPLLSAALTNQCELSIHSSTNLVSWTHPYRNYWLSASGEWLASISTSLPCEFFRGTQVIHPAAEMEHNEIATHTLDLDSENAHPFLHEIILRPESGGGGVCQNVDTNGSITAWSWEMEPYSRRGTFYLDISPYNLSVSFHYNTPTSGVFKGVYFNETYSFSGSFSDSNP